MSMLDWNGYRQQVLSGVGALGKLSPDTVKGYVTLGGACAGAVKSLVPKGGVHDI